MNNISNNKDNIFSLIFIFPLKKYDNVKTFANIPQNTGGIAEFFISSKSNEFVANLLIKFSILKFLSKLNSENEKSARPSCNPINTGTKITPAIKAAHIDDIINIPIFVNASFLFSKSPINILYIKYIKENMHTINPT